MKKKLLISLNTLIIVFEIIALFLSAKEFGTKLFTYYTQYSNIFTLITSFLLVIYLSKNKSPKWLKCLRYISVNVMTITFVVVAGILVPMLVYCLGTKGFMMFTHGSMLYHHLLCPILLFISFVFLEKDCPVTNHDCFYVLIPTFVYGIIMIILNLLKIVDGPYPFFRVLYQPIYITVIWIIAILLISYLVGISIYKLSYKEKKLLSKKRRDSIK